jgi:hypothetical protein
MLVQQAIVLLVDADGILNHRRIALSSAKDCIHVMNCPLAVASEFKGVRHVSGAVLSEVKGVFLMMGYFGASVRNHHLGYTDAVKQRSGTAFVRIVHADVGENNPLAVVEPDVHLITGPG